MLNVQTAVRKFGKLPARQGGVNSFAGLLLLSFSLAGCLPRPPQTIRNVSPGEWHATLGGEARAPFAGEDAPVSPREGWRVKIERGLTAAPVVNEELLVLGSTGRVLAVLSAGSGHEYWHRRFNGSVTGTPLRAGSVLLTALSSRDGRVQGTSIDRGRKLWLRRLHSPVVGELVLAGNRLYAGTAARDLYALDPASGDVLWRARLPGALVGAPAVHGDALLLATSGDTLARVALADGRMLAAAPLPATPSATLAVAGERVILPLHSGQVAQYQAQTLQAVRTDSLGERVLAAPVVDADGAAFVLTRTAEVWRITTDGARRIASLGGAAAESFTLARNGLLVGRLDGTLFLLQRDGTETWRRALGGALRAPVALSGGALYAGTLNGRLVKLQ